MKQLITSYLNEGSLTREQQILLLAGLFSARREEKYLKVVAELAIGEGIPAEKLADIISSAIISRGIPTWLSGIEALRSVEQQGNASQPTQQVQTFDSVAQCITYYDTEFEQRPDWVNYLIEYAPDILLHYSNLRTVSLKNHQVSRLLKELLLYAINICDRYPKGIAIHKTNALNLGATNETLYDVRKLCVLALGVGAIDEPK